MLRDKIIVFTEMLVISSQVKLWIGNYIMNMLKQWNKISTDDSVGDETIDQNEFIETNHWPWLTFD